MANILRGWISTQTGLPSLYTAGFSGVIRASDSTGTRLIDQVNATASIVSDSGAPAGETIIYSAVGAGIADVQLVRSANNSHLLTDRKGRGAVRILQLGNDELDHDPQVRLNDNGSGFPSARYALNPQSPKGSLECFTVAQDTRALRALIKRREPLWLIHNRSFCQIKDCDITGTRLIQPTSFRESRTARTDQAERAWKISYRVMNAAAMPHGAPVVTWGEWQAWGADNSPKGWQNWSEILVAQKVAGLTI